MTIVLFGAASALLVWSWNRFFTPVPVRLAIALWLACTAYQGTTLFTARVDVPANLAYVAYPWQATGRPAVKANTGIVFTQLVPWTRVARDVVLDGELPLWNRHSASGAPMMANQQTAIFHPFTLIGLLLPIGKAFTLTAALRLFTVAFFTFVLLRQFGTGNLAAGFGAIAFAFCTFHVVWLLFPLGLATMMLPACLASAFEFAERPRLAAYIALVITLSCSVLGGHPESALWVWIVTAGLCVYMRKRVLLAATAFIVAMLLTAFFWLSTLQALQYTSRYGAMQSLQANPADHGLSHEWLLTLVAPNVLGTPVQGTYKPPRGSHPAVLNDYGEVSSGYAGLATLGLALAAPFVARRRRGFWFAMVLMLFAFLTIAEAPLWRDALRAIPLVGISLHQRLRVVWALGVCIAAALTIDETVHAQRRKPVAIALATAMALFAAVYAMQQPQFLPGNILAITQFAVPIVTTVLLVAMLLVGVRAPLPAAVLVLVDLVVATYRYNPSATPADLYPATPAIRMLQQAQGPFRMAASGWSFLADTPSYYGIEDVKTTDPVQHARYMRFLKGYLRIDPASYDLVIGDYTQPFFDFLNIRYVYVPPDQSVSDLRFVERYRGTDGAILENTRALPRYFLVPECWIEPNFDQTVWRLKQIRDFARTALVDHIPEPMRKAGIDGSELLLANGTVNLVRYGANETELAVKNDSWALLATSDVHWPGWRAYVNGRRVPPVIVNGAFVGCFIPPGGGRVVLRYRPNEVDLGLKLLAAGVLLLVAIAVVTRLRSRAGARAR